MLPLINGSNNQFIPDFKPFKLINIPQDHLSNSIKEIFEQIISPLNLKHLYHLRSVNKTCYNKSLNNFLIKILQTYLNLDNKLFILKNKKEDLKQIKYLDFNCSTLNDQDIKDNIIFYSELQSINLKSCKKFTGEGVIALANNCPKLQIIDLGWCKKITDEAIKALASRCPKLQSIKLSYCANITNESVIALANNCPNLQIIDLDGCKEVTNEGVIALANNCPNLQIIDLGWCKEITNEGVIALANNCPELRSIKLSGCKKLANECIKALASKFPKLQFIGFSI